MHYVSPLRRCWTGEQERLHADAAATFGAALGSLITRYANRPMDFADATLVHLAQRESLHTILTVDHRDFETYRTAGRRRFPSLRRL